MVKKRLLALLALGFLATSLQAEEVTQDPYRIGIEDVLGLVVWNEPALTLDLQVRPDGAITVPLLNDVHVDGISLRELSPRGQRQRQGQFRSAKLVEQRLRHF